MKRIFHLLSYLAYPIYTIGGYFYVRFITSISGSDLRWDQLNLALLFLGIGVSISTLQDNQKTQNNFSKRTWEHPTKGKIALIVMAFFAVSLITGGLWGVLRGNLGVHKDISVGIIVLGLGFVGLLKAAIEMRENHVIRD